MGRRNKYRKLTKKEQDKKAILVVIFTTFCMFFYLAVIRKGLTLLQKALFCNSNTWLLVPNRMVGYVEVFAGAAFLAASTYYLKERMYEKTEIKIPGKTIITKKPYSKHIEITIAVSFIIMLISFFSYSRVEEDKVYVRDIRTLFMEKGFSWSSVKSVKIDYYKNGRGSSYNLLYLLKVGGFSINVQGAIMTSSEEVLKQREKEIHKIIKERNIPVNKEIEKYDDRITEFLRLIGESK